MVTRVRTMTATRTMPDSDVQADLDVEAFYAACFSLARTAKWENGPVDVDQIDGLAVRLAEAAERHIAYLQSAERDPNGVTRAIRYIEHHHGGPWSEQVHWFDTALETLIELTWPNTRSTSASEAFYRDIEDGIGQARADYD